MNKHSAFFRIQSAKASARTCAKHNLRELMSGPHIDVTRSHFNIVLHGGNTSKAINESSELILREARSRGAMRKNQVRLIEAVFSLSSKSELDFKAYFDECWQWGESFYGIPCISAIIHNDEAAPHMHALYVPCKDGKMCGSALLGNRTKIRAAYQDLINQVGGRYGLELPETTKRLSLAKREEMTDWAIKHLHSNPQLINEPTVRDALKDSVIGSPQALCEVLENPIGNYTFENAETLIGACEIKDLIGTNPIGNVNSPPTLGGDIAPPENAQTLSCVGNVNAEPVKSKLLDQVLGTDVIISGGELVGDSRLIIPKVVAGIGLYPLKAPYAALLSLDARVLTQEERLKVGMWAISTGLVFSDYYGWASRAGIDRRTCHVEWEFIEANYSHDILRKTHVS